MNLTFLKTENEIEYLESLPRGYVKLPQYKEIFNKVDVLSIDNAVVRENIILLLYNPETKVYYPRYLFHGSNREKLLKYFQDGNLYINETDLIWSKQLSLM